MINNEEKQRIFKRKWLVTIRKCSNVRANVCALCMFGGDCVVCTLKG
jgi:hypothetical protein